MATIWISFLVSFLIIGQCVNCDEEQNSIERVHEIHETLKNLSESNQIPEHIFDQNHVIDLIVNFGNSLTHISDETIEANPELKDKISELTYFAVNVIFDIYSEIDKLVGNTQDVANEEQDNSEHVLELLRKYRKLKHIIKDPRSFDGLADRVNMMELMYKILRTKQIYSRLLAYYEPVDGVINALSESELSDILEEYSNIRMTISSDDLQIEPEFREIVKELDEIYAIHRIGDIYSTLKSTPTTSSSASSSNIDNSKLLDEFEILKIAIRAHSSRVNAELKSNIKYLDELLLIKRLNSIHSNLFSSNNPMNLDLVSVMNLLLECESYKSRLDESLVVSDSLISEKIRDIDELLEMRNHQANCNIEWISRVVRLRSKHSDNKVLHDFIEDNLGSQLKLCSHFIGRNLEKSMDESDDIDGAVGWLRLLKFWIRPAYELNSLEPDTRYVLCEPLNLETIAQAAVKYIANNGFDILLRPPSVSTENYLAMIDQNVDKLIMRFCRTLLQKLGQDFNYLWKVRRDGLDVEDFLLTNHTTFDWMESSNICHSISGMSGRDLLFIGAVDYRRLIENLSQLWETTFDAMKTMQDIQYLIRVGESRAKFLGETWQDFDTFRQVRDLVVVSEDKCNSQHFVSYKQLMDKFMPRSQTHKLLIHSAKHQVNLCIEVLRVAVDDEFTKLQKFLIEKYGQSSSLESWNETSDALGILREGVEKEIIGSEVEVSQRSRFDLLVRQKIEPNLILTVANRFILADVKHLFQLRDEDRESAIAAVQRKNILVRSGEACGYMVTKMETLFETHRDMMELDLGEELFEPVMDFLIKFNICKNFPLQLEHPADVADNQTSQHHIVSQ